MLEEHIGLVPLDPAVMDNRGVHRILVIRQHDQLGDLLLSTPVLRALKSRFPASQITMIARAYTAVVLENHPFIDEVLTFHEDIRRWTPQKFIHFKKRLRSGFDLTVVLNTVSHSLSSDILAYLSRSALVLGSEHMPFGGCKRNFFYNLLAPYAAEQRHQTERNLDIVRIIGADTNDVREIAGVAEDEKAKAATLIRSLVKDTGKTVIGMHPGAGKPENRWPAAKFAAAGDLLCDQFNAGVILFRGPREQLLVDEVAGRMKNPCAVAPVMSLRDLAAAFSQLTLFLCNDTGVMHLAAAVGTPLVAIFGPTDPAFWKPPGSAFVAVRGRENTVMHVTVKAVVKACRDLLKSNGRI